MRITDFPELIAPTGNDLLVTVDIANDLTKKVKLDNLPISLPALTALATKQDSLVSGVTIKTINSTSLLGSGNITIAANPSGVSGAIQFSNGSAFASDAANLFWDDTNNRLGVGTNDPQTAGHFRTSGSTRGVLSVVNANDSSNYGSRVQLYNKQSGDPVVDGANGFALIYTDSTKSSFVYNYSDGPMIFGTAATERMRLNNNGGLTIKGSGSTSATTSLLVQNSAGAQLLKLTDDGVLNLRNTLIFDVGTAIMDGGSWYQTVNNKNCTVFGDGGGSSGIRVTGSTYSSGASQIQIKGATSISSGFNQPDASAQLDVASTTQGFLPPRGTNTQMNAIASPATGLVFYDTTNNKLCCYNGSTWNDLF